MAFPASFTLYVGNDQYVEFGSMIDGTTDNLVPPTYLNGLNGTLSVKDPTGALCTLAPALTVIPFVFVAASNGIYRALIEQVFNPPYFVTNGPSSGYLSIVDFTAGGSEPRADGHWEVPTSVKVRKS